MSKINRQGRSINGADVRHLLPDEDPEEFQALWGALISELAPQTAFQRRVAVSVINVEWDMVRHRRLLAAALRTEFCSQAGLIEQARDPGRFMTITQSPFRDTNIGRALLRGDAKEAEKLRQLGVTMSELTAAALISRSDTVAYHEARIADLERRRRQLMADLEIMKARGTLGDVVDVEVN